MITSQESQHVSPDDENSPGTIQHKATPSRRKKQPQPEGVYFSSGDPRILFIFFSFFFLEGVVVGVDLACTSIQSSGLWSCQRKTKFADEFFVSHQIRIQLRGIWKLQSKIDGQFALDCARVPLLHH